MRETNGGRGAKSVHEPLPHDDNRGNTDIDYHTAHTSNSNTSTHDTDAPSRADGRSDKATDFYPNEGNHTELLKRLRRWNDGEGESSRRGDNRWANICRDVHTVTVTLSLPQVIERGAIDYLQRAKDSDKFEDGLRSVGRGRIESIVCGAVKVAAAREQIALTESDFAPVVGSWNIEYDGVRSAKNDLATLDN